MKFGGLLAALLLVVSLPAWTQVQVVRDRNQSSASAPKGGEARALFIRIQALERQVLSLQGLVEEMENKLNLLRAAQRDQLSQFERRLSLVSGGNGKQGGDRDESRRSDDSHPAKTLYRTAHNLMQRREFDEAKQGFERYVANYPKGDNITNALFWLGELSLVVTPPSLAQAKQSFSRIVNDYPDYRRMPTVLYKMAKIYHSQGNDVRARVLLKQVIREHGESSSNAVELAQSYLTQNFPRDG